ncbi:unnamed protein product [Ceutorhynchus assimilis]|uniref:Cilia- and flagella-associated protein 251 n=1 Tax=Ceutorhynchus assimilis TaxID=467358 RepID=A0A9N9QIW5_9CUCU|nr:unnamed protein product [Ceutorhynchus assimilis]
MSETSITFVEDRADLVYITKLINVDDFGLKTEVPNKEESETTIGSDVTNKPTESDMKLLEEISGARLSRKLKPFQISYAYGINANVGVINLTQDSRKELIFSSINSVVIYDYCTKKNKHLQAHPSTVNSISIDANGEYLVSTDEDKDGCLIVWCCKTFNPLFSIYKPYPDSAIIMAAISGCARYLVTMGDNLDYYSIDVWLWTLAEDKPKDTYLVNKTHGKPVKICFHPDKDEHIMVVFETQVFFLTWHSEENMLRPTIIPQIYQTNYKLGLMTCGTYMKYSHSSYVSTSTGCILLFRNTLYTQEYEEGPLRNKKMYINAVKVTKSLISTITATPNRILVTGDSRGTILFFDRRIKLLFWIKNPKMGKITAISFALTPKTYSFVDSKVEIKYFPEHAGQILECQYNDMEAEITDLIDTPKDVTMDNNPFLLSDFFISTADSNIFAYDFIRSMATPLFHTADAPITSIDAHDGRPYIVLGFENGRITLINYETKQIVSTFVLPKTKQIKKGGMVSSIKYSRQGLHLVCGRLNGEIWILDPSILQPKITEPFQKGRNQIMKIDFAYNSMQFAYYDNNRTVVLFNYNSEKKCWEFRGKIRSHSFPINDMMFFSTNSNRKSRLYTIGADRYMLQYNNWALNNNDKKPFIITSRDRIEQSALPMNFTAYTRKFGSNTVRYILFADNKHKIKVMHAKTKTPRSLTVAPSSDCFKDAQIRKMKIVPSHNNSRYMVFMTEKHLGISILPPDGNPFRNVGYMVHPKQVTDFALSKDGKQVFTFGKDDRCVLQWHIDPKSVELAAVMGGTELEPFYSFLDGGRNGAFVLEVEELFYYMQSLQQENFDVPRKISDCINLSEVPHLAKACGFFPSNFELEMMMLDIRFRDYDEDGQTKEEVSFVEFMKLLINHMPYDGYSIEEVDEHFKVLCSMADNPRRSKIDRNDFAALIQTDCDGFHNMHSCLTRLLGVLEFGPGNFNFLPTSITKNYLLDKILGLECEEKEEEGDDDYDFDDADFYVTSLRRMM